MRARTPLVLVAIDRLELAGDTDRQTFVGELGSLRTFASMRSSSLGSSLAAIETAGREQSAAVIHRIKFRPL